MNVLHEDAALLGPNDPDPVEWVNADSRAPVLLLCEHAGQAVPESLGGLGLPPGALDGHIGWDIGAEALARAIAARLSAPLVLQRYSRLVIDCNRPPDTPQSVPAVSDGVAVPLNAGASGVEREARRREVFEPLDLAIADGFARHPRHAAFSVHSFTRTMNGSDRIWHAGFLSRADTATASALMSHVCAADDSVALDLNQPYEIEDDGDWFIPVHAEPRGLRHTLIEVRNDQLDDEAGVARWADLLSDAIATMLEPEP